MIPQDRASVRLVGSTWSHSWSGSLMHADSLAFQRRSQWTQTVATVTDATDDAGAFTRDSAAHWPEALTRTLG